MRIGLFDSGIGGLTVLKTFQRHYPNNEYIFYGDTLHVPYGDKNKEELLTITIPIIHFLEEKQVDIIIIACGTVSSTIYSDLKAICKVPLYNIIDSIPSYIEEKKYKSVLLMATSASIKSHVLKSRMLNINLIELACPKLVPLIESDNEKQLNIVLDEYLKDIPPVEAIILGCTHYPIIKEMIENKLSYKVDFIDMGEVLAQNIAITSSSKQTKIYFSKTNDNIIRNVKKILK